MMVNVLLRSPLQFKPRCSWRTLLAALGVFVVSGLAGAEGIGARALGAPNLVEAFAHPAFARTWERTDRLVSSGQVQRSFYWGPNPNTGGLLEDYAEGVGGKRLVQYFDKSRMEINNPNGDQNDPFFVTNGLLTVELISGKMQVGNFAYQDRAPADIPLASDTDDPNAPTYVSFQGVSNTTLGDHPAPNRVGEFATLTINKAGQVGNDPSKANVAGTQIVFYEPTTRHNIPKAIWDFLNQSGPVYNTATGRIANARLSDPWFYATGLPISGPYWAKVKIANQLNVDVMIQAFERRVVTYVPSFPAAFRVQMGNIGQHYYDWRYGGQPPPPTVQPLPTNTPASQQPTATRPPQQPTATPTLNIVQPGAENFIGTWINDDDDTTTVGKIWIRQGSNSNELRVQWFSPCSRGLCAHEDKTVPFTGIPFNITLDGFTFSMSIVADIPPKLSVVFGGSQNLIFHRARPVDYIGTWLNDDPNEGLVGKLWIDDDGTDLRVRWFEACGASLCPHPEAVEEYRNEPFNITIDGHEFRIVLSSAAGDRLAAGFDGNRTFNFHRVSAPDYEGVWTNIHPDPEVRRALPKVEIRAGGSTLNMDVFGNCGANPCPTPSFTATGTFNGEPVLLLSPAVPNTRFTISFDNTRASRLAIVLTDVSTGTQRTLIFAR